MAGALQRLADRQGESSSRAASYKNQGLNQIGAGIGGGLQQVAQNKQVARNRDIQSSQFDARRADEKAQIDQQQENVDRERQDAEIRFQRAQELQQKRMEVEAYFQMQEENRKGVESAIKFIAGEKSRMREEEMLQKTSAILQLKAQKQDLDERKFQLDRIKDAAKGAAEMVAGVADRGMQIMQMNQERIARFQSWSTTKGPNGEEVAAKYDINGKMITSKEPEILAIARQNGANRGNASQAKGENISRQLEQVRLLLSNDNIGDVEKQRAQRLVGNILSRMESENGIAPRNAFEAIGAGQTPVPEWWTNSVNQFSGGRGGQQPAQAQQQAAPSSGMTKQQRLQKLLDMTDALIQENEGK